MSAKLTVEKAPVPFKGRLLVRKVPPQLHADFKAECARKGISMNAKFLRMMKEFAYSRKR